MNFLPEIVECYCFGICRELIGFDSRPYCESVMRDK